MMALADGFRGAAGAARFELLFERLAGEVAVMASGQAMAGEETALDRWAEIWEMLISLPRAAEGVNLDRADVFYTALGRLRSLA